MIAIQCRGATGMLRAHLMQTEAFHIVSLIVCIIVGAVGVVRAARASPHVTRTTEGQLLLPFIELWRKHTIGKYFMYI